MAAAALGSGPNDAHLRSWADDPAVADELKEIVAGLRRELPWNGSPPQLAGALRQFYVALGGSVGSG